jgi:hypothetical protein
MARATSSLPVPLSPVMSTVVALLWPILRTMRKTSCIAALLPTKLVTQSLRPRSRLRTWLRSRLVSSACSIATRIFSIMNGLLTKS